MPMRWRSTTKYLSQVAATRLELSDKCEHWSAHAYDASVDLKSEFMYVASHARDGSS